MLTVYRYQVSRRNLRSNPHIAAWHFHQRFRSFFDNVFKPKFGVTDAWFRYEFQGRGSTHVHGFAWIDPTVAPEIMANIQEAIGREQFTEFWSKHVFAVNPDLQRQPPARRSRGTYNTSSSELENKMGPLSDVVNRTQVHACSESYCKRKRKRGEGDVADLPKACRFHFPRSVGPASTNKVWLYFAMCCIPLQTKTLTRFQSRNPHYWTFCAGSNDSMMNQYNPTVALVWRANTDLSPYTDLGAVTGYIAKYCAKDETPTVPYTDIARSLIPFVNVNHVGHSFATCHPFLQMN